MAKNIVFITIQIVMKRSAKGSITIVWTIFLILSQAGQQSQIR